MPKKFLNKLINLLFKSKKLNGLITKLINRIYRNRFVPTCSNNKTKHLFEIINQIKLRKYLVKYEIECIKNNENERRLTKEEIKDILCEPLKFRCIKYLNENSNKFPKEKLIKLIPDLRKYFTKD